eukprot:3144713-Lingulodinium_polyedra.AAC.1
MPVLRVGDHVLLKYRRVNEYHARLVVGIVDEQTIVGLTPDGDVYAEDVGPAAEDVEECHLRPGLGMAPFGLRALPVYDFVDLPDAMQLIALRRTGAEIAAEERRQR